MISDEEIIKIKKMLEEHEKRIGKLESVLGQEERKPPKEIGLDIEKCIKLSKDAGITEEQLRCVFDFEEVDLSLITTMLGGKNEAEKQFRATASILTTFHYCYNKDEIRSQDLRKKLEWLGIKSLANLSINLANYKQFILPKGKPKSPEFAYKITYPGIKKGLEIIKELASA